MTSKSCLVMKKNCIGALLVRCIGCAIQTRVLLKLDPEATKQSVRFVRRRVNISISNNCDERICRDSIQLIHTFVSRRVLYELVLLIFNQFAHMARCSKRRYRTSNRPVQTSNQPQSRWSHEPRYECDAQSVYCQWITHLCYCTGQYAKASAINSIALCSLNSTWLLMSFEQR